MSNYLEEALRQFPNHVKWQHEGDKKPPLSFITGRKASVTNPSDWSPYNDIVAAHPNKGFVLTKSCNLGCIDLDNKTNDSRLHDFHRSILEVFKDSYAEMSPGGNGCHIWFEGALDVDGYKCPELGVEVYSNKRYMTVTHRPLPDRNNPLIQGRGLAEQLITHCNALTGRTEEVKQPTPTMESTGCGGVGDEEVFVQWQPLTPEDCQLCEKASKAKNGPLFTALYNGNWQDKYKSESEADFALVDIIVFWAHDKQQAIRVFLNTALGKRPKTRRTNYLLPMIEKAWTEKRPRTNSQSNNGTPTPAETPFPDPMNSQAFHGLAGKVVDLIFPATEADKHGLLLVFLIMFGFAVGHYSYVMTDGMRQTANNFLAIVGRTSKGRKGTAVRRILELFKKAFLISGECNFQFIEKHVLSGLSTGEGLIQVMRDPTEADTKDDYGVSDKRLLIIEGEFAKPLKAMMRKENTLSPILRCAWDGDRLQTLARSNKHICSNPHLSAVVQITLEELRQQLSETEIFSGFGNRFLWLPVKRSKLLPENIAIDEVAFHNLALLLNLAIHHGYNAGKFEFDDAARGMWKECYEQFPDIPGLVGALTSRAEAHVMRLALTYALLDGSDCVITIEHLRAAMEVWTYCENGVKCLFGNVRISLYDRILEVIRKAGHIGVNTTGIHNAFSNKKKGSEINEVLLQLEKNKLIYKTIEQTEGKPVTVWYASGVFSSASSPNSPNSPPSFNNPVVN